MDELRVPKRKAMVELVLPGRARRTVTVFLSEFASEHAGAERLSDLLNGQAAFIPVLEQDTDALTFIHRDAIAVARVDPELEPAEDAHTLPTEHELELTMLDGSELQGLFSYVRPPERSRLNDVLNEPAPFLRLLEGDRVALVNKNQIARIATVKR